MTTLLRAGDVSTAVAVVNGQFGKGYDPPKRLLATLLTGVWRHYCGIDTIETAAGTPPASSSSSTPATPPASHQQPPTLSAAAIARADEGCRVLSPLMRSFAGFGAELDAPMVQLILSLHVRAGRVAVAGWFLRQLHQWRIPCDSTMIAYFLRGCLRAGMHEEAIRTCGTLATMCRSGNRRRVMSGSTSSRCMPWLL